MGAHLGARRVLGWNVAGLCQLLPTPAGGAVLDLGCWEGRAGRELLNLGYQVIGVDRSATLARAAAASRPALPVVLADAAVLPFADHSTDLVVACMSLLDVDDLPGTVREIGRILRPGVCCVSNQVNWAWSAT